MKESKIPDSSLFPEILKLTDKLTKDPKSKLFVPLAEEYMKSKMLDEAVMVLMDGLKIHPQFLTARVTLGKVYLEKGQIQEAKAQFEQVMEASPDNLFVHRRLARIYKDEGQVERAGKSCQAVLSQNPKDAEMKNLMEELNRLSEKPVVRQVFDGELRRTAHYAEQSRSAEAQVVVPMEETAPKLPVVEEARPAAPVEKAEEMATEALADLYIKQGYYEKGIEVYQRLIAADPSNTALQRKLEETEVLVKLLTEGPAVKTQASPEPVSSVTATVPPQLETVEEEPAQPARQDTGGAAATETKMTEKERQEAERIKRLEAWLDSIRKGQGR